MLNTARHALANLLERAARAIRPHAGPKQTDPR